MSGSNNAAQQNQAANQQIAGNTQAAQAALANYLQLNPSILSQAPHSIAGPQQFSGVQGPHPQVNMPRVMPPMQQQPNPQPQQGAPPPPNPNMPPGLLQLLSGQRGPNVG